MTTHLRLNPKKLDDGTCIIHFVQIMGETEGMLKLFASPEGESLGCHAYGAHSADIVQEVSVLMCRHTTVSQLRDMVHIHPTL